MTTVHGIVIHGRYRYAAFYRLTDLPLPTTPRHLQEWRRLPLRSRRGQDMGQDSAHGTCRQAGAVTRPRLWASANGRRNWRGARSEDPETPPSRLAGPGEATRPRVNRHEWTYVGLQSVGPVRIVCRVGRAYTRFSKSLVYSPPKGFSRTTGGQLANCAKA